MRLNRRFRPRVEELEPLLLLDGSINVIGPTTGMPAQTLSYELDVVDPDSLPGDTYSFAVNWGSGSTQRFTATSGAVVSHAYGVNGTYTISVSAMDTRSSIFESGTLQVTVGDTPTVVPGVFAFSSNTYEVRATDGYALVTVLRNTGSDGTVSVDYTAAAGTAVDGVNFTAVSGTLTFGPGETTATFQVPVLNGPQPDGQVTVNLTLSNPQGGASLATPATAVLLIDPVLPQPTVNGPTLGVPGQPLTFTLGTSNPSFAGTSFTYQIDWNDGTTQVVAGPAGTTVKHVFTATGAFNVGVTLTDSQSNSSQPTSTTVAIVTAALEADPTDPANTALFVGGTLGDDFMLVRPADLKGGLQVTVNCQDAGTFTPTGHLVVYGQAGDDVIFLAPRFLSWWNVASITAPAVLFGGGGDDVLIAWGSTANNVLVGGDGNDVLLGGGGRDFLIGGNGNDVLFASERSGILVGGSTDFDNDVPGLGAIMSEWGRTDVSFQKRVAHLNGSLAGGLNGGTFLNATTAHDDDATDYLLGDSNALDWFLADTHTSPRDYIWGYRYGDVITQIS